ncbi:MAG: hypothetical protein IPG82_09795 [Saprospiraceae bacterium]|nr:hypothetical protein [Saprospiraceae bacterium]MBK7110033.1 hypothetical protein [Bacteroidota bacterium]MBK8487243.1 hypothetical protein [Bacteroidota bacterium]MBK8680629.1 hypothetical protein [Bacteroidota bacterium]
MKKYYSSLAIVIVIAGHFVARIIMQDAYTFSAADYINIMQTETPTSSMNINSNTLLTEFSVSSSINHRNSFSILPTDAFSSQWNP